jgi:hypothetical protein
VTGRFSTAIPRLSAGGLKQEIEARAWQTRPCCYLPRLSKTAYEPTWAGRNPIDFKETKKT